MFGGGGGASVTVSVWGGGCVRAAVLVVVGDMLVVRVVARRCGLYCGCRLSCVVDSASRCCVGPSLGWGKSVCPREGGDTARLSSWVLRLPCDKGPDLRAPVPKPPPPPSGAICVRSNPHDQWLDCPK